jgi:hypothetical protein
MFSLIITVDYELPAGGRGDVRRHMIDPVNSLQDVCEASGAKLTVMVEIGELWAFERAVNQGYKRTLGYDPAGAIRAQLIELIRRGHDVQLHLHPQWINALWDGRRWLLDYAHYFLTDLLDPDMATFLRRGREDLERLLQPGSPHYRCVGFRAGNWNTHPAQRYLGALRAAGFESDTSVFKWGLASSPFARFDYRQAYSNVLAWYAREDDINVASGGPGILEVPITAQLVPFTTLLSLRRALVMCKLLYEERAAREGVRRVRGWTDPLGSAVTGRSWIRTIFGRSPCKLDFCKLTAKDLLRIVEDLLDAYLDRANTVPAPLVLIGHSKHVGAHRNLATFLERIRMSLSDRINFSTYRAFIRAYKTTFCEVLT